MLLAGPLSRRANLYGNAHSTNLGVGFSIWRKTFLLLGGVATTSALSLVAGIAPPGMPPAGAVRWLRPSEVSGGDGSVLFAGDVPGSSPMVAGQVRQ